MTKFEEEFKALTSWDWVNVDLIQQILTRFGNWHSDEEFQELLDKYSNLNDNYEKEVIRSSKLESQIIDLKSQLQQQALPVVPECVAEWIDKNISVAHNAELMIHNILICAIDNKNRYLFPLEVEKFVLKNPITFLNAIITGKYEVEKPQLFYIELPNVYGLKNKVLVSKVENGTISEFTKGKNYALKLTEQEIKSIDESYWQFAVPVEDGE
ncbi:DUF1642 domain-containing protein [Lactococcus lactis]|uniref:DUF1642 domain-containing protein n=1 Tax=Lactococcus lactis TaxID=1358 RepID=UPI00210A28C7|nr:DUF1642 domain-containing protein [Lactococcus lactis]MCQ4972060.1 DUF1642 domain-containing protein [Lactococcus lactis]MCQ4997866.1 DUF1642 domain-containing protein [Lactococcus lactis]